MKNRANWLLPVICFAIFLLMILKADLVIAGAYAGIEICLYTVFPSLFPFIFLSSLLTDATAGLSIPFLKPLGRLCGIPAGSESIFLAGILGGYPAGAQAVAQQHKAGHISSQQANHLLRFCNNAGPAFIFGIIGSILKDIRLAFIIWIIHILSAIITGWLFANSTNTGKIKIKMSSLDVVSTLHRTVKTMAKICGWVILFRIIISILDCYVLEYLPVNIGTIVCGILELSNGCIRLKNMDIAYIFVASSLLLSFGGICVWMQTASIIKPLNLQHFCLGKCVQSVISVLICFILSPILFDCSYYIAIIGCVLLSAYIGVMKKSSSILKLSRV